MEDLYIYKTIYEIWHKKYKYQMPGLGPEKKMLALLDAINPYLAAISDFLKSLNLECDEIDLKAFTYQFSFSFINYSYKCTFLLSCKGKGDFIFFINSVSSNKATYSTGWESLENFSNEVDKFKGWLEE